MAAARWLRACIFLVCSATVKAQSTENGVVVLNNANFQGFIDSKPLVLVHYFAPWCAKCRTLAPKLEQVAASVKTKGWSVTVAKIDAKEDEDGEHTKDVYGYPTIKVFAKGKAGEDYEGKREVDAIMAHLERLSASESLPLVESPSSLASLTGASKHPTVLGLFRMPVHASAAFKTYKEAAFQFHSQGVTFAYSAGTSSPPVLPLDAAGKKPTVPGLVLLDKKGEKATQALPVPRKKTDFTLDAIREWLGQHGIEVSVPESPGYEEKEYSDPAEAPADSSGDEPYDDD
jgi:protein disulfide-isomerase-like protein